MSEFYRFIRPVEFDFTRSQVKTSEQGGICFFVSVTNGLHQAGYSICDPKDLFNRNTARRVAKRAPRLCLDVSNVSAGGILDGFRKQAGQQELLEEVRRIEAKAEQAYHLAQVHKEAVEALQLGKRYNELQS